MSFAPIVVVGELTDPQHIYMCKQAGGGGGEKGGSKGGSASSLSATTMEAAGAAYIRVGWSA